MMSIKEMHDFVGDAPNETQQQERFGYLVEFHGPGIIPMLMMYCAINCEGVNDD